MISNRRVFLTTFGAVVSSLATGCAQYIPEAETSPAYDSDRWTTHPDVEGSMAPGSQVDLLVQEHEFATADGYSKVSGRVQNTGDYSYPGVEVEVTLRGADGAPLESKEAESDDALPRTEYWQFAVVFEAVDPATVAEYEIRTAGN